MTENVTAYVINNKPIIFNKDGHTIHTMQFSEIGYEVADPKAKDTTKVWIMKDWDSQGTRPARILPYDKKIAGKYHCQKEWYQNPAVVDNFVRDSARQVRLEMQKNGIGFKQQPSSQKPTVAPQAPVKKNISDYSMQELGAMSVDELMELVKFNF